MIEKAVNIEIKASLQQSSGTKEIDSRCPKSLKPLGKKDKDNTNREHRDRDKDKDKTKSHNSSFVHNQP